MDKFSSGSYRIIINDFVNDIRFEMLQHEYDRHWVIFYGANASRLHDTVLAKNCLMPSVLPDQIGIFSFIYAGLFYEILKQIARLIYFMFTLIVIVSSAQCGGGG